MVSHGKFVYLSAKEPHLFCVWMGLCLDVPSGLVGCVKGGGHCVFVSDWSWMPEFMCSVCLVTTSCLGSGFASRLAESDIMTEKVTLYCSTLFKKKKMAKKLGMGKNL